MNRVACAHGDNPLRLATTSELAMNSNLLAVLTPLEWGLILFVFLFAVLFGPFVLGAVLIQERQVGIVVKKFSSRGLPPGRLLALDGEAGYQADTLPPGLHFGYWRWQYRLLKVPVIIVPQG